MRTGVASRTAQGVAIRRALHQVLDRPPVFEDPLALRITGEATAAKLLHPFAIAGLAPGLRSLRAFVAVRSRYAEDELAAFVAEGGTQYVILGAGLDTFAYRNLYSPRLKVFEVDHPDTQAWKICRLRTARIPIPDALTFLSIDFEMQSLDDVLRNAPAFDETRKVFFSCLGVTPYLTSEALLSTLACIAALAPGSRVVFDYTVSPSSLNLREKIALQALARRVAGLGETFRLFLDPHKLSITLRQLGFTRIEDLGRHEINSRYFCHRADKLEISNAIGRLLTASL